MEADMLESTTSAIGLTPICSVFTALRFSPVCCVLTALRFSPVCYALMALGLPPIRYEVRAHCSLVSLFLFVLADMEPYGEYLGLQRVLPFACEDLLSSHLVG